MFEQNRNAPRVLSAFETSLSIRVFTKRGLSAHKLHCNNHIFADGNVNCREETQRCNILNSVPKWKMRKQMRLLSQQSNFGDVHDLCS